MRQSLIPKADAVLLTRPMLQSQRFARSLLPLSREDLTLAIAPLTRPEALDVALPEGRFAALILTSETGAQMAMRWRNLLPDLAFCVGDRTAAAARAAGFDAISARGDARDLLALLRASPDLGRYLYLHGQDRAADVGEMLKGERDVTSLAVYAQRAQPLSEQALGLLRQPITLVLPIFSPRNARLLVKNLPSDIQADLWPLVISENARNALPARLAERALVAERPDGDAMLSLIQCFPGVAAG